MKLDLNSFYSALFPQGNTQWTNQTNAIFHLGVSLLRDFDRNNMTRDQEQDFYAIAIGAIIAGLAYNKHKFGNTHYTWISTTVDNKYYAQSHYPLDWAELYKKLNIDDSLKQWTNPYRAELTNKENPVYLNMIKLTGAKVLAGELPFDKEQMNAIFPKLNAFFAKIESERNREYQQIDALFEQALVYRSRVYVNSNKRDFLTAIVQLKQHTLQQFRTHHPKFTFDKCISLAQQTKELADSLMHDTATKAQLEQFKLNHYVLDSPSLAERILSALVVIILGLAAALVAFTLAGPIAAAAAGVSVGTATLGLFALKKGPVATVGCMAKKILVDSDAADDLVFDEENAYTAQSAYLFAPTYAHN